LTFLAEWGDRTQIATVTLAASNDAIGVTLGAIVGHTICTVVAVMGGRLIAGRISERTITAIGGLLFLIFAVVAIWEGA
jgi:putative Ca2+/H+ antiporter (TMEM165/GDT1 family)